MTEQEAIERLKCMRLFMQIEDDRNDCKFLEDDYIANDMAIKALEEISLYKQGGLCLIPTEVFERQCVLLDEYKELGTVEELQELKEKEELFDRNIKMFNSIGLKIRNNAIDEYMNALCDKCLDMKNECYQLECPFCADGCDIVNIAEKMK